MSGNISIEFHDSSKDINDDQIRVEVDAAKGILVKHDGRECVVKQFKSHSSNKMYDSNALKTLSQSEREEVFKEIKAYFEPAEMKVALARASQTLKESKITVNPQLEKAHVEIAETQAKDISEQITKPEWEAMRKTLFKADKAFKKTKHVTFQLNPVAAKPSTDINISESALADAAQMFQKAEADILFNPCKEIQKNIQEYLKERSRLGRDDKTGEFDVLVRTNDNPAAIRWQNATLEKLREMWKGFQAEKAKLESLGTPKLFKLQWEELGANEDRLKKEMDEATKFESWESEVIKAIKKNESSIDNKDPNLPRMKAVYNKLKFRHEIIGDADKPPIRKDLEVIVPKEELESRVVTEAELKKYNAQLAENKKIEKILQDQQQKIANGQAKKAPVIPSQSAIDLKEVAESKEAAAAPEQNAPSANVKYQTGKLFASIRELVLRGAMMSQPKDKVKDLESILQKFEEFNKLFKLAVTEEDEKEIISQGAKLIELINENLVLDPEEEAAKKYLLELNEGSNIDRGWFINGVKTEPENPDLCTVVLKKLKILHYIDKQTSYEQITNQLIKYFPSYWKRINES